MYHRRRGDVRDLVDLDGRPYGFAIHDSSELSIYDGRLRLIFRPDPAAPHDFPDDLFELDNFASHKAAVAGNDDFRLAILDALV